MVVNLKHGIFTISLDFELYWGVSDRRTIQGYYENLINVVPVVEKLLDMFINFGIHATWATVGMIYCESKTEISRYIKVENMPLYENSKLSNYRLLPSLNENKSDYYLYFALPIIRKLSKVSGQEIGTHTFSHYYCLEKGQSLANFEKDIDAALSVAKKIDTPLNSHCFPQKPI